MRIAKLLCIPLVLFYPVTMFSIGIQSGYPLAVLGGGISLVGFLLFLVLDILTLGGRNEETKSRGRTQDR